MQNGLYSVTFTAQGGTGAGVVVLQDGQIRGGDSGSYYRGSYSAQGGEFSATVSIRTHTHAPGLIFVFGKEGSEMTLSGQSSDTSAEADGRSPKFPGLVFKCRFERLTD